MLSLSLTVSGSLCAFGALFFTFVFCCAVEAVEAVDAVESLECSSAGTAGQTEYFAPVMSWPNFVSQMKDWHDKPNDLRAFESGHPVVVNDVNHWISLDWETILDELQNKPVEVMERQAECNEACFDNNTNSCVEVANEFLYKKSGQETRHMSYWLYKSEMLDPDFRTRAHLENSCVQKDQIQTKFVEAVQLINETGTTRSVGDVHDTHTSRYLSAKVQNHVLEGKINQFTDIMDPLMNKTHELMHIWMGSNGATSTKHWDDKENFYFVVRGLKRFELQSPTLHSKLMIYPSAHTSFRHEISQKLDEQYEYGLPCGVAEMEPSANNTKEKEYEYAQMTVDVHAGQMLYMPSHWFHKVSNLKDDTIAVNLWYNAKVYGIVNELKKVHVPVSASMSKVISLSYLMYLIEQVKHRWDHSFGLELNQVYYLRIYSLMRGFSDAIKSYNDLDSIEKCDELLMWTVPDLQYCINPNLDLCDLISMRQCHALDPKKIGRWDSTIDTILRLLDEIVATHSIGAAQMHWFMIVESMVNWVTQFQPDWVPMVMIANYI